MGHRFLGEFYQKVDGKGRVSIPAEFRRVLEAGDPRWSEGKSPEFVINYADHRRSYLECYTIDAHEEVGAQISALPRGSMNRRMLERLYTSFSQRVSVDETGRIVLSAKLRAKPQLEDQAYFIATGDTFQIWKPETFADQEAARVQAWLDEFPEDFDPLVLLDQAKAG